MFLLIGFGCSEKTEAFSSLSKPPTAQQIEQWRTLFLNPKNSDADIAAALQEQAGFDDVYKAFSFCLWKNAGNRSAIDEDILPWLRSRIERGESKAEYIEAILLINKPDSVSQQSGINLLEKLARQKNESAQVTLALEYFYGQQVPKDEAKASAYLTAAAEQGNAVAKSFLWDMAMRKVKTMDDIQSARKILKGAKGGSIVEIEILDAIHEMFSPKKGENDVPNEWALRLLQFGGALQSARYCDPDGTYHLYGYIPSAPANERTRKKVRKTLEKLSDSGSANAPFLLALFDNFYIDPDTIKNGTHPYSKLSNTEFLILCDIRYMELSAQRGHIAAQFTYACILAAGKVPGKGLTDALACYKPVAQSWYPSRERLSLEQLDAENPDSLKDDAHALKWLIAASQKGDTKAELIASYYKKKTQP